MSALASCFLNNNSRQQEAKIRWEGKNSGCRQFEKNLANGSTLQTECCRNTKYPVACGSHKYSITEASA